MATARDLGLVVGRLEPGSLNAITDVPGVSVGHSDVRGEEIFTGVTAVLPHQGDLFSYALDVLNRYFEDILAAQPVKPAPAVDASVFELAGRVPSADARLHTHLDTMVQLGKRLAELHAALAGDADSPAFAPELFTTLYQRSLYQSMRNLKAQVFYRLQQRLAHLPADRGGRVGRRGARPRAAVVHRGGGHARRPLRPRRVRGCAAPSAGSRKG